MQRFTVFALAFVLTAAWGTRGVAQEGVISGCILWDVNCNGVYDEGVDLGIEGVEITLLDAGGAPTGISTVSANTTAPGFYGFENLVQQPYQVSVADIPGFELNAVQCLTPWPACDDTTENPKPVDITDHNLRMKLNFLYCREPEPPASLCWMTGGGVKFDSITRTHNAEMSTSNGPKDSVGGVVAPSCSGFPSNGGQWNHVAHGLKLHLTGFDIEVVRCGNVDGHPPGTDSPVCEVNFIEWVGTGRLQGIGGNKFGPIDVSFFGRVEDRNEPGNEQSAKSGGDIDRYFLRVVDGGGTVHILVDEDGVDDGAVDPLTITGGNFQIHCTSCDDEVDGGGGAEDPLDWVSPILRDGLGEGMYFLRGDSNSDGLVDVSDAIFTLGDLFMDTGRPSCFDAADTNDDGVIDLSDPVSTLEALYVGAFTIPAPYPEAGPDATRTDNLNCVLYR